MKRLFAVCLALALALGLWGCAPEAQPGPSPSPAAPAPVLAFFGDSTQPWRQELLEAAADWCEQAGWELVEYDCMGAAATQTVQVADLKRTQGAALAVLCATGGQEGLEANAAALAQGGTKVVVLSGWAPEPMPEALCVLAPDNGAILSAAAGFFREAAPDAGVVILHDVETDPLEAAAGAALEEAGVTVAEESYTWGSVDYARDFLADVLARHSRVGDVLAFSRTGVLGANAALAEMGRREEVRVLCLDGTQELLADLGRGELDGLVTPSARGAAEALTEALTLAAQGKTPDGLVLPVELRRS